MHDYVDLVEAQLIGAAWRCQQGADYTARDSAHERANSETDAPGSRAGPAHRAHRGDRNLARRILARALDGVGIESDVLQHDCSLRLARLRLAAGELVRIALWLLRHDRRRLRRCLRN